MKEVQCKICGIKILKEYEDVLSRPTYKYFSALQSEASEEVHTEIYLTCDNGHASKYYCTISTREEKKPKTKIGKLLIKHWVLSGLGLLCLGLSLLFVWLGIYIINKPKPAPYLINLQSFEGRVLSEPVEIPSWMQTFQIISSFDDALKWDYNAVLQYSQTENVKGPNMLKVEIFKADCRFTGAVHHAEKELPLWDPWLKAKAVYNVDKKELKFLPQANASFFLFSIAVEFFLVFIVYSVIIEFNRKLKKLKTAN